MLVMDEGKQLWDLERSLRICAKENGCMGCIFYSADMRDCKPGTGPNLLMEYGARAIGQLVSEKKMRENPFKPEPKEMRFWGEGELCPHCGRRLIGYEGLRTCYCKFCGGEILR